jgi:hypothetical protein
VVGAEEALCMIRFVTPNIADAVLEVIALPVSGEAKVPYTLSSVNEITNPVVCGTAIGR